ncbi:MAG: hypothetical protein GY845_21330 [Planctomycetes bacterium]|nr:hypothetical protein [Planctomycetota bacterium]
MPDRSFIITLAKLLIAAAWADGELKNEEINALKDLLFSLEDVTGEEWAHLEIYMDTPVCTEERDKLLGEVLDQIRSEEDKKLVMGTLENLFQADGVVSDEERAVLEEVKKGVSDISTGIVTRLSRMMKGAMSKRVQMYNAATQRDSNIDDYIKNTVYYQFKSEIEKKGITIELPEKKIKKLCLAGGLLARISAVDSGISDEEKQSIKQVLSTEWGMSEQEAQIVAEISCNRTLKGLDYFHLTKEFFDCTSINERRKFLKCLFKIANVSNKTSYDETEEIRKIAMSLKLSHKDFIEAKLTIPDEDREVL